LTTKSPRYESSKKFNNPKLEGVQLQDKGTLFTFRDFHRKGVGSMSNLRIIPRAIFCSFVQLEVCKSCATPLIQGNGKNFIKINLVRNVWKL
jgi:hypothetical protein